MNRFEQQKATSGRLVKAWDHVFKRTVAVKPLPEGISAPGNSNGLVARWERWLGAPHPGLLKPLQLDLGGKLLVREWVWGFSLLDLLRHRHRLEGPEALALLEAAAGTMDHAEVHGLMGEARMDKWIVEFPEAGDDGSRAPAFDEPVDGWPAWQVRLDPLRLGKLVASGDELTQQLPGNDFPGVDGAVAAALGFLRELLGASMERRDAPLSALSDDGNRVLMAARKPGEFASATELSKALLAADHAPRPEGRGCLTVAVREYELILAPATPGPVGEKLFLEPASPGTRALQLVHRDELRLGRSSTAADLTLRFAERSQGNEDLTRRLSRVHARLQRRGDELRLLDGSDSAPSSNGTYTREGQLTDPAGLPLRQVTLVQLGTHWRGTLWRAPAPPERVRLRSELLCGHSLDGGLWGAVFVAPAPDCRARMETVWLLEEAGFGLEPEEGLAWDREGLGGSPAGFRIFDGAFLLLNRRLDAKELLIDLHPIPPGAACILRDGMALSAGRDTKNSGSGCVS